MEVIKVSFRGDDLEVIQDSQAVVVKDICENLGLKYETQYNKLRLDETYQGKLLKVKTNGGIQDVFCIPLSKLNGWLFSINPNKVKPEVRQKLIDYKNECFDVLYRHFNKKYDTTQLERENVELKRAMNRLLKQPTPGCEELLKIHYPILHNNILELANTLKDIDIDTLGRFVFFMSQIKKQVNTLSTGLKHDKRKRGS